jgi:rhodanese-related sulfurtransferase
MEAWIGWAIAAVLAYFVFKTRVPADATLSPAQLRDMMSKDKDLQLIDVRSPGEYGGGYLARAKNIPLDQIGGRLDELKKDRALVVYCRGGHRSALALNKLRAAGFSMAKHMGGGITAWQRAGLPVKG